MCPVVASFLLLIHNIKKRFFFFFSVDFSLYPSASRTILVEDILDGANVEWELESSRIACSVFLQQIILCGTRVRSK